MCLTFVGMDVLTCCVLLLCCWLVCDRFEDLLLSFVGILLWFCYVCKIKFTHENEIDNTINYLDNHNKKPTKESNRSRNLSQTNQQHNSNPQQIKTSIPTKIKHIQ